MEVLRDLRPKNSFLLVVCFGSLLLYSCYSINRDCEKFHTGSFEFSTLINGEIKTSYFSRTEDLEIETYGGKIDSARIRWVNDCECILNKLNPKSNQDKRPVQIKILSTLGNTYTFEYSLVGKSDNKQRGTIKKIK
tara:strand:+ start:643 stop:1050 length:408 start_codon:yes stop_codon:yes gene_type:complete